MNSTAQATSVLMLQTTSSLEASRFRPDYNAPANYKNPDKIQEYINAKNEEWISAKAAFDPLSAEIVLISLYDPNAKHTNHYINEPALVDGPWTLPGIKPNGDYSSSFIRCRNEGTTIIKAAEDIRATDVLIGSNLHGFHLPMLLKRAAKYHESLPERFRPSPRYFSSDHAVDTFDLWGMGSTEYISAEKLALFFNIISDMPIALTSGDTFEERFKSNAVDTLADIERAEDIIYLISERMKILKS